MRWTRQLLMSVVSRRDAIYCVLTNWSMQWLVIRINSKKPNYSKE